MAAAASRSSVGTRTVEGDLAGQKCAIKKVGVFTCSSGEEKARFGKQLQFQFGCQQNEKRNSGSGVKFPNYFLPKKK